MAVIGSEWFWGNRIIKGSGNPIQSGFLKIPIARIPEKVRRKTERDDLTLRTDARKSVADRRILHPAKRAGAGEKKSSSVSVPLAIDCVRLSDDAPRMAVVLANKCENEKIEIYSEIENINMKFVKINFIEQNNKDLPCET